MNRCKKCKGKLIKTGEEKGYNILECPKCGSWKTEKRQVPLEREVPFGGGYLQ